MMTAANQGCSFLESRLELTHGRKRRNKMRLNLCLDGGQMTSDAKGYVMKDIKNGEESALIQT